MLALCPTAAPYWLHKPSDQVLAPEENGRLVCRANGNPKPRIEWLVNGQPIESTVLFIIVTEHQPCLWWINWSTIVMNSLKMLHKHEYIRQLPTVFSLSSCLNPPPPDCRLSHQPKQAGPWRHHHVSLCADWKQRRVPVQRLQRAWLFVSQRLCQRSWWDTEAWFPKGNSSEPVSSAHAQCAVAHWLQDWF